MILVNDKELNLNQKPSEAEGLEKTVLEEIENIEKEFKGKFPLKFRFVPEMFFERTVTNSSKQGGRVIKRTKDSVAIRAGREVLINNRRQKIQYFETVKPDPKTREDKYMPKNITMPPNIMIGEDKIDLIFFLLAVSPNVVSTYDSDSIKKVGRVDYKPIELFDEKDRYKKSVDMGKKKAEFEYQVLSNIPEDAIRKLAVIYGIDSESEDYVVRGKLKEKIKLLDKEKSHVDAYSEFLEKAKSVDSKDSEKEVSIKSKIENAKKDGVLVYEKNKWYICDGDEREELCKRSGSQKADEVIFNRVEADRELLDRL